MKTELEHAKAKNETAVRSSLIGGMVLIVIALVGLSRPLWAQTIESSQVALPAISPQAIVEASTTIMRANVKLSAPGSETAPADATLLLVDRDGNPIRTLAILRDDGANGDDVPGDWIYSGQFVLDADFSHGSLVYFRVSADFGGGPVQSVMATVEVLPAGVPTDVIAPDLGQTIYDEITGEPVISNEVVAYFLPGTSTAIVEAVAGKVSGSVAGFFHTEDLDFWQIRVACSTYTCLHQKIDLIAHDSRAKGAEPDYVVHGDGVTPNDTYYGSQWQIKTIGADKAWAITRGGRAGVKIAILDTGVWANHEDFLQEKASKVELGPNLLVTPPMPKGAFDDSTESHGTGVAAVAAAYGDNKKGIAGVCWSCPVLAIKVLNANEGGDSTISARGIREAINNQALVLNMSYGNPPVNPQNQRQVNARKLEEEAVADAVKAGRILVAAAGNDKNKVKHYPAADEGVLSVGGTDGADRLTDTTDTGSWVLIYAPGHNIYTASKKKNDDGKYYSAKSGTSFAAPYVTGTAALVWATNPQYSAQQVKEILLDYADHIPSGRSSFRRLNAFAATWYAAGIPSEDCTGDWQGRLPFSEGAQRQIIHLGPAGAPRNDAMPRVICGVAIRLDRLANTKTYAVKATYEMNTWDSYAPAGKDGPGDCEKGKGAGYFDSMSISLSAEPYWKLQGLKDPIDQQPNLLSVGDVVGGESRGPKKVQTIKGTLKGKPEMQTFQTNYLNLVLDTSTQPDDDLLCPSWGTITIQDITPK